MYVRHYGGKSYMVRLSVPLDNSLNNFHFVEVSCYQKYHEMYLTNQLRFGGSQQWDTTIRFCQKQTNKQQKTNKQNRTKQSSIVKGWLRPTDGAHLVDLGVNCPGQR